MNIAVDWDVKHQFKQTNKQTIPIDILIRLMTLKIYADGLHDFFLCVWGGGGVEACPYCQKICEQKVERNKKRLAPFPTVVINSFKPGVPFMGHRQTE